MRKLLLSIIALWMFISTSSYAQHDFGAADDYLQFLPIAAHVALGLSEITHNGNFDDIFISTAVSMASDIIIVESLKFLVNEKRPDGVTYKSFPSGHSTFAFTGAELIRHEFGWGWGAGAYAVATYVAVNRVVGSLHWWWDVAAGAAIGILTANLGYLCVKPVRKLLGVPLPEGASVAFAPSADPFAKAFTGNIYIKF